MVPVIISISKFLFLRFIYVRINKISMVGLVSDYDDFFIVVVLVIFAPIGFIVGVSVLLSSFNAPFWLNAIVTLFNIGLVGYLVYRWELVQTLGSAFQEFMQMT